MRIAAGFQLSRLLGLAVLLWVTMLTASGQSQTGQISGRVIDPTGAAIAGAKVQVIHALTRNTREFVSEATGGFVFPNLLPGTYIITVEHPGFKTYQQNNVVVADAERVDLHQISLSIGDIKATVE